MKRTFSFLSASLALVAFCAVAQAQDLLARDAWVRATPGSDVAAAYVTLHNGGVKVIKVVGIESPAASMVMLHETSLQDGVSRMRPHEQLSLAPGQTVKLEPGGLHVMLQGLTKPLIPGMTVPLLLKLADGTSLVVAAAVRPLTAQ